MTRSTPREFDKGGWLFDRIVKPMPEQIHYLESLGCTTGKLFAVQNIERRAEGLSRTSASYPVIFLRSDEKDRLPDGLGVGVVLLCLSEGFVHSDRVYWNVLYNGCVGIAWILRPGALAPISVVFSPDDGDDDL